MPIRGKDISTAFLPDLFLKAACNDTVNSACNDFPSHSYKQETPKHLQYQVCLEAALGRKS